MCLQRDQSEGKGNRRIVQMTAGTMTAPGHRVTVGQCQPEVLKYHLQEGGSIYLQVGSFWWLQIGENGVVILMKVENIIVCNLSWVEH